MLKRFLSLLLVFTALLPIAAMETPPAMDFSMLGYEPSENNRLWPEHLFFKRMEEQTGIRFSFEQFGDLTAYQTRLSSLENDGELPDVLFKARLSPVMAKDLFDKGVLVDLGLYLPEHAPNLYALLQAQPEYRAAITLEDGAIPALPFISGFGGQNALWINQAWLEELHLKTPVTYLELEQVLSAFRDKDPNRNGKKDEVPLSFLGPYDLKYLAHAFGLLANDFNVYMVGDTVSHLAQSPQFPAFISWCRQLYEQGLLDKDGFAMVDSLRRQTDAKAANRYGAFFGPLPTAVAPVEWTGQYKVLMPLTFEGKSAYRMVAGPVFYGAFALTAACDDIPAMLGWVDRLYTEEGAILASIGLEGEDFAVDGDGSWRLLYEAGDRDYYIRSVLASDQSAPGISAEAFQQSYADPIVSDLTAQTMALAEVSLLPFPDLPLTREEEEYIAPLQSAVGRYVDESIARFVLGEWEANEEQFSVFNEELNALGMSELVGFWQKVYDGRMVP